MSWQATTVVDFHYDYDSWNSEVEDASNSLDWDYEKDNFIYTVVVTRDLDTGDPDDIVFPANKDWKLRYDACTSSTDRDGYNCSDDKIGDWLTIEWGEETAGAASMAGLTLAGLATMAFALSY